VLIYHIHHKYLTIKILTDNILIFKKQRNTILHLLKQIDDEEYNLLLSIPGVGINTACGIIGEIVEINNFKNPNALLAYAGLNPLVHQSGKYEAKHTSNSKKGSRYLRNALIQVSRNIIIYNYDFNLYYKKKISEGKSYNCSIGHISKKLVGVIFYILKNKTPYKLINQ
jgi:transposase